MNCKSIFDYLVQRLHYYVVGTKCEGLTIGVSGGIDSAVVSTLCAKTGLPTMCVTLPIYQAPDQVIRGKEHIKWLKKNNNNVQDVEVDLTEAFETFRKSLPKNISQNMLLMANVRDRLRMTALYSFGNIVAGTGNKIEDFGIGFFTKYGNGGVDVNPIGDLLKSEVYELGAFLGINNSIMQAVPTDGLWMDNRSDEEQIGASYPELEEAYKYCCKYGHHERFINEKKEEDKLSDRQKTVLSLYLKRHFSNEHKMRMPEIFVIPDYIKKTKNVG